MANITNFRLYNRSSPKELLLLAPIPTTRTYGRSISKSCCSPPGDRGLGYLLSRLHTEDNDCPGTTTARRRLALSLPWTMSSPGIGTGQK